MSKRRITRVLPVAMRAKLKRPLGHLFRGQPAETVLKLKEFLKKRETPLFAVVGDFTAKNILAASLEPDIVVVDHRIMRITVDPLDHGTRRIINTENAQGTIDAEAWNALEEAVILKSDASVIVEGEEDLLVLPLISLMPLGSVIVYGQPREGLVVVEVTEEMKRWNEDFLTRMEES
ncbi:DUF359 domain-containing protein [Candidatus Bathyarchaeota archaeon]|nr:MAG: DUF359 domain-containing protein [Candidatus Bathyarchaeota archaeon]